MLGKVLEKWIHDGQSAERFVSAEIQDLINVSYHLITLPKAYGGVECSLEEWLAYQVEIAKVNSEAALVIGWHVGIVYELREAGRWDEPLFQQIARGMVEKGQLLNRAASEPATGSPTRGGKPETTARRTDSGWIITGRKTFTTGAPILHNFFVTATKPDGTVGEFLIQRDMSGVGIEETWQSSAMSRTASDDLLLSDVEVPFENEVHWPNGKKWSGWLLHIPACYFGVACRASEEAIHFASTYKPNSVSTPIGSLPHIQAAIGEMEMKRLAAEAMLFDTARKYMAASDPAEVVPLLGATKVFVMEQALEIVDLAMRIVGARSLVETHPLHKCYLDVRAGLHNPPMKDAALVRLAESVVKVERE
ncbi:MAG: acyl-CoA dehydrogenase family protein [Bacilli bacterium]